MPDSRATSLTDAANSSRTSHLSFSWEADLEEREAREEQEEQEVQEEQEEQGALGVQVALEALRAHGYTTRRR
ncbi:unnamed protein product [Closterium sp. NIES-53]